MGIKNLERILNPRRVAVIGASDDSNHCGSVIMHNLLEAGFEGVVYPVNNRRESVQGIHVYSTVGSLPKTPDLAVVCIRASSVPQVVRECGEAGIPGILIVSSGFRESGEEGRKIEEEIARILASYPGMRIVGPNSLGIINPSIGLNASITANMPKPGHLAFLSQSGALSNSILDWAVDKGFGFSYFISVGNMLDTAFSDLIDFFGADYRTKAIMAYLQSIPHPRSFMSAARASSKIKPIVVCKSGRFGISADAAASHTGAMAAEDAVYDAAFQRAGVVRVNELDDIFDVAELLACRRLPKGERLAIVSNAGGPAIVSVDALLNKGGKMAVLSEATIEKLRETLPAFETLGNPLDLRDDAPPDLFSSALHIVQEDQGVDAVLVILTPQFVTDPTRTAELVLASAQDTRKPILAAWMGGERVRDGRRLLNQGGVPTHSTPEQAIRAFMHLVDYTHNLELLYETPRDIPVEFDLNRRRLHRRFQLEAMSQGGSLTDFQAKELLKAYGIPIVESRVAHTADEAVERADEMGYPVVIKVLSPQIVHKLDVGGVVLNVHNAAEVRIVFESMMALMATRCPGADIQGVTVQRMIDTRDGFQIIFGSKKDPTFGAVIMAGIGGIAAGVHQDRALGLPPLNERLAMQMLSSLRSWPLLEGYRGQAGVNLDLLIEMMIRFSYLVADYPEIQEMDINPMYVKGNEVLALDATLILDANLTGRTAKRFEHLAIRPYPEEYVRAAELKDGSPVTLRPVKPEDEPLWRELLSTSSAESLRFRFRSAFNNFSHELAIRHCFIDYEREISMVGEVMENEQRKLVGIAGLFAGADIETAEFAVIVNDTWQGKGLGGMLLDHCIEIAGEWGVTHIVAETDPANQKMLASFSKRGFTARTQIGDDVVYLTKKLEIREVSKV